MLVDRFQQKTGYPAEMLEPDLDLEADLGIDTVRQMAVVSEARASLGLATDPAFKLREHPTLRKLATYLAARTAAAAPVAAAAAAVPAAVPAAVAADAAVAPAQTWTRAASLRIEVQDPGVAASLQNPRRRAVTEGRLLQILLAAMGPVVQSWPQDAALSLRDLHFGEPAFLPDSGVLHLNVDRLGASPRLRVLSADAVHLEGAVELLPGAAPPQLPTERRAAIDRRSRPRNGLALLNAVRPAEGRGAETLVWAGSSRFDEVTGGARIGEPLPDAGPSALAALVESAFWLADFGWYGLGGSLHGFASLRAARCFRLPSPGEEIFLVVDLLAPRNGEWLADAIVTDKALQVIASLEGLCGGPLTPGAFAPPPPASDAESAMAWHHFHRRLQLRLAEGEDA